jgi:hypothetical protein
LAEKANKALKSFSELQEKSTTYSVKRAQMKAPPEFEGKPTENVQVWLRKLKAYLDRTKCIDDDEMLDVSLSYLKGAAEKRMSSWWDPDYRTQKDTTWSKFKGHMIATYEQVTEEMVANNKLDDIKQTNYPNVAEYSAEFLEASTYSQSSDYDLKLKYAKGLIPSLHAKLEENLTIRSGKVTLVDCMNYVARQAQIKLAINAGRPNNNNLRGQPPRRREEERKPAPKRRDPDAMEIDAVNTKGPQCYNCQQYCHVKKYCKNPFKARAQANATRSRPAEDKGKAKETTPKNDGMDALLAALTQMNGQMKALASRMGTLEQSIGGSQAGDDNEEEEGEQKDF